MDKIDIFLTMHKIIKKNTLKCKKVFFFLLLFYRFTIFCWTYTIALFELL